MKAFCVCLSRQIDYQKQLKTNMEALGSGMRALIAKRDDISRRVEFAELEGRTATSEVTNWLQEVESMKSKVSDIQKNFEEQTNCWKGLFPNCYWRRKISKKSSILIVQVNNLIAQMDKVETGVTVEPSPLAADALPTVPIEGKTANLTRQEIWNCILGTENRIIGVHGMGGVGKTTIMRKIHNDLIESSHFDCVIWIIVSDDVDVNKLQQKIAKKLKIDMEKDDDEDGAARKILGALKRRKKFLLILDDMWKPFDLDKVGIPIPSEENGCKVVLTTRNKGICGQMRAHAIEVRVLSEEESWEFFKNIVGGVILSDEIENLAKDVAKECCNLPLAIKTVGGSMCGVDTAAVWKDALKDLKDANGEFQDIDKVFVPLKFSYTQLHNHVLKSCFLFCSLYPEDYEISDKELIDNWICEGLIHKRGTSQDDINKGHAILDDLIKVSMLERCENLENEKCVKMHDLVRDMAINITRAENPRAENPQSVIYAGRQLTEFPMELPEDAERISLMDNDIKVLSGEPKCPHLLTLFLQENLLKEISPDSYFNHMCSLRVLDLSSSLIKSLPVSVSYLNNLRALILNQCRCLTEVPSLEKLVELRVLDLSGTNIRELPSGVEAMVYLRRLGLSCTDIKSLPESVCYLKNLHELILKSCRDLKEVPSLEKLVELRVLDLSCTKIRELPSGVEAMVYLRILDLSSTHIKSLPESVSYLKNLHELILNYCRDLEEVPSLEKLVELRVLDLSDTKIRELPSGVEAMVYLQSLHLDGTKELRIFPTGIISKLSYLKELSVLPSGWMLSSKTGEGAGIEEILNSPRLAILDIQFRELSDFLRHAKSNKWLRMKRFHLSVGRSHLGAPYNRSSCVEISDCNLVGEENRLLLPYNTKELVIRNCHFTRLLNRSELYLCEIIGCQNMKYLMEEEPLLPDLKELFISGFRELLVLCKGIPSPDALKSLESLHVASCNKLKYLLPARLLQQLRCLKRIEVRNCRQMKEIVGEDEEMGITRDDDNNAMLILSQLQHLLLFHLPELKGIFSGVFISNALETIDIASCPELKKLCFSVDNLPCALKQIKGEEAWWVAVEWDHPETKAHFDSIPKGYNWFTSKLFP